MSEGSSQEVVNRRVCPACGGEMEIGYIPDHGHSCIHLPSWYPGPPKPSLIFGDIKSNWGDRYPLEAWRCTKCSCVMLFAPKQTY